MCVCVCLCVCVCVCAEQCVGVCMLHERACLHGEVGWCVYGGFLAGILRINKSLQCRLWDREGNKTKRRRSVKLRRLERETF